MEEPNSYLSPRVKQIICRAGVPKYPGSDLNQERGYRFIGEGCLNWKWIKDTMNDIGEPADSFEYFEVAAVHLAQCFGETEHCLGQLSKETFKARYYQSLQWTSAPDVFLESFEVLQENVMDTGAIHSLLLSTALLERSLGNIYLMKGTKCPSMLKDLLLTTELEEILGSAVMKFLRLLLGPATSLNIRNVIWHGFPLPGEIPKQYGYTILMLAVSLGQILIDHNIQDTAIQKRAFVDFPQRIQLKPVLPGADWSHLLQLAQECKYVSNRMLPLWHVAVDAYSNKRYGDAASLLLPQMEHMLRCVFADANQCQDRKLTAEMLEKELPDGTENRLREMLGDNIMDHICDLLAYPAGPRVRDRVSHGETNIQSFPQELTWQIFYLCASVCQHFLEPSSALYKETSVTAIREATLKYESIFHPIALVKEQIRRLAKSLEDWKCIKDLKDQMGLEELISEPVAPHEDQLMYEATLNILDRYLPKHQQLVRCIEPYTTIEGEINCLLQKHTATIFRWKEARSSMPPPTEIPHKKTYGSESELVGYINRITLEAMTISEQIVALSRCRYDQWRNKELRSRQRNNFIKMMNSLPILSSALRLITLIVAGLTVSLDDPNINSNIERAKTIKFLRYLLQYAENMCTFTSPSANKWDVAVAKTYEMIARIMKS